MTTAVAALAGEGKGPGRPSVRRRKSHRSPGDAAQRRHRLVLKIAYDENYARFSPGVQILLDVTQALLDDASLARADSCATADHPMIDRVWRERLPLADRLLCVSGPLDRLYSGAQAGSLAPHGDPRRERHCETLSSDDNASRFLSQQPPNHLPRRGHRHLLDERDLTRIFMRGEPCAHEALDVDGERIGRRVPRLEHDERFTISVRTGSGLPTTAASATAGWRIRQSSISVGPMR